MKSWLIRIRNATVGFLSWLKVGYPFVLFCLVILFICWLRFVSWLYIWIILVLSAVLIVAEMLNYAIENLCDVVSGGYNDNIKLIKNVCAGSVLVSGLTLGAVGVWVLLGGG